MAETKIDKTIYDFYGMNLKLNQLDQDLERCSPRSPELNTKFSKINEALAKLEDKLDPARANFTSTEIQNAAKVILLCWKISAKQYELDMEEFLKKRSPDLSPEELTKKFINTLSKCMTTDGRKELLDKDIYLRDQFFNALKMIINALIGVVRYCTNYEIGFFKYTQNEASEAIGDCFEEIQKGCRIQL